MKNAVIVSACRTAIGKFQGQFRDVSARDLAVTAGKEAIRRAGIDIKTIEEIVMGECYPHMQGSLPARQVSMRIGLDESSNAVTVNQNCASGMRALEIACSRMHHHPLLLVEYYDIIILVDDIKIHLLGLYILRPLDLGNLKAYDITFRNIL